MDVTVVIATYGDPSWIDLAHERAWPSAAALGVGVVHVHSDTLHEARNMGLDMVATDWVCHLDADDELEPGFFDAIDQGIADVRAPAVRYVRPGWPAPNARMPRVAGHQHHCIPECLPQGNWLVVGSVARTDLLREVGGWRDFSWSEDWDLWLRCHLAGASIEAIPRAVYRAHVRPDSRNRAPDAAHRLAVHQAIYSANFPEETRTP